jgi:hypothetical protein
LLGLLLVGDHLPQLFVGFLVLGLELNTLDSKALSQLLDLGDRVPKFVQSNVEMTLLLF